MKVTIYTHPEFERQLKRFKKKYHTIVSDYSSFLKDIKENPFQGVSFGKGLRKVRLGISDKGGGKRGGMRVITFSVNKITDEYII